MGKVYEGIDERLRAFIGAQHMYFVATAPSGAQGRVTLSPKGMGGTFAVLDEHRVAYLDYFGSGAETIAHLRENGRITVMFCAFAGPPKILRLHGTGAVVHVSDPRFGALARAFEPEDWGGVRGVILVEVERVSDSCGFAVPFMDYVADRTLLPPALGRRDLAAYAAEKNLASVDGLPALTPEEAAASALPVG